MKYIEDWDDLVKFLCDFHMIENKPTILAVDGLDKYFDQKSVNSIAKKARLNFVLTLLKQC